MKLVLSFVFSLSLLIAYFAFKNAPEEKPLLVDVPSTKEALGLTHERSTETAKKSLQENPTYIHEVKAISDTSEKKLQASLEGDITETEQQEEDVHFNLRLNESTHYFIEGSANADMGNITFTSKLLPSNEVELTIFLKQDDINDVELSAYFDLANFTMELDGKNSILSKEHKQMLNLASLKIQSDFKAQYEDYDFPEHALMLTQMLAYWSLSPEGYVHEKRAIVSQ